MSHVDRAFLRAYQAEEPAGVGSGVTTRGDVRTAAAVAEPAARRFAAPPAGPASPSPRRPLSSFSDAGPSSANSTPPTSPPPLARREAASVATPPALPEPIVESRFRPALEVESFRWSASCQELTQQTSRWERALAAVTDAIQQGRTLIGVAGSAPGVGATTVLCCLARLLAGGGRQIGLVDGDFRGADLARQLGLAVEIGWEDVLAGRTPLAEAAIRSQQDAMTIIPLRCGGVPAAEKLDAVQASVTAGVLRYRYDLVLFDLGAITDAVQGPIARRVTRQCRLDAVILVESSAQRLPSQRELVERVPELKETCLGVIQNGWAAA